MVLTLTLVIPSSYGKLALVALVMYSSWLFKLCNPSMLLLMSSLLLDFETSSTLMLIAVLPGYIGRSLLEMKFSVKGMLHGFVIIMAMLLSVLFGDDANIRTLLICIVCLISFVSISATETSADDLRVYAMAGMLIVFIAFVVGASRGNIKLMFGRLSINDNIRDLANATVRPLILLFASLVYTGEGKKKNNILLYLAIGFGVLVLFATLSKGAIAAIVAGVAVLFLATKMPFYKKLVYMALVSVLILAVVTYLSNSGTLQTDRLIEQQEGFNGRFDIWGAYLRAMAKDFGTMLFGFGPGEVRRLGISNAYSHSLFFDILFAYGAVGFVCITTVFVASLWRALITRNAVALSIGVCAVMMYATHGVSTAFPFYALMGLSESISRTSRKA